MSKKDINHFSITQTLYRSIEKFIIENWTDIILKETFNVENMLVDCSFRFALASRLPSTKNKYSRLLCVELI